MGQAITPILCYYLSEKIRRLIAALEYPESGPLNIQEIKETCRFFGIHLTKGRGQNFLHDENILDLLAKTAIDNPETVVLEIGAGLGNWTEHLAPKTAKVYAIEVDRKICSILRQRVGKLPNVEVVEADALEMDFGRIWDAHRDSQIIVTGNLPYNITSPIIFRLIGEYRQRQPFCKACFMVQREVAERMIAEPGGKEYGRLAVMLNYYCKVVWEKAVPRQCFFPKPTVDSVFVSLNFGQGVRQCADEDALFDLLVRTTFAQRRKQIQNTLKTLPQFSGLQWESILSTTGIKPTQRPEEIPPEGFLRLVKAIGETRDEWKR